MDCVGGMREKGVRLLEDFQQRWVGGLGHGGAEPPNWAGRRPWTAQYWACSYVLLGPHTVF